MEIKSQYRNDDLGVEALVVTHERGFIIKLIDLEAEALVNDDFFTIFPTFESADEYARGCVADF